MHEYVASKEHSDIAEDSKVCFGFEFKEKENRQFDVTLSFYETYSNGCDAAIPSTEINKPDFFQTKPQSYYIYTYTQSGFLLIQKILNEYILKLTTGNKDAKMDFGLLMYRYPSYVDDLSYFEIIIPTLIIIVYIFPMSVSLYRMVKEKETKIKEGMKMMGLDESAYFMSYSMGFIFTNLYYSLVLTISLYIFVLTSVNPLVIISIIFPFGMAVFSFAYLCQSLIDKTRVVMIVSILIYFIMFAVSFTMLGDNVSLLKKSLMSIFPHNAFFLGVSLLARYETSKIPFGMFDMFNMHGNFSVFFAIFYLSIDGIIYMFIGYYLQNVLTHEYGVKRSWNFLCTRAYWCKPAKKAKVAPVLEQLIENKNESFEDEKYYQEKINEGECLRIVGLKKEFDDGKLAVDGLNLNLFKNEIFALLGHNGAGKSTTINILSGLFGASEGAVYYENENILDDMDKFRKKVGICPQQNVLFDDLTVKEQLEMFCVFKGIPQERVQSDIEAILKEIDLTHKTDAYTKSLSGGQKRKLCVAIALVGGSEVVFLDEPSSGMDVNARRNLWDILKRCTNNRIIILTTHYMEEASVLGKRIGIMSNGKLKCCGSNLFLINKYGQHISLNIIKRKGASDADIIQYIKSRVKGEVEVEILTEEVILKLPILNESSYKQLFLDLDSKLEQLNIETYGISMPTLEDVFLNTAQAEKHFNKPQDLESDSYDKYDPKTQEQPNYFVKFSRDTVQSLKKRLIHSVRDKKSIILEIVCPILLVFISLVMCSAGSGIPPSFPADISQIERQTSIFTNPTEFKFPTNEFAKYEILNFKPPVVNINTLLEYGKEFPITKTIPTEMDSLGSFYIIKTDLVNHAYEFVTYINPFYGHGSIIFPQLMMSNLITVANGEKEVSVNFINKPFPLTYKNQSQIDSVTRQIIPLLTTIAFSLIPANFITLIIKEREQNTKHLQIISGLSLFSYWFSNYIFEIIKCYLTLSLSIALMALFGQLPEGFILLCFLYGFALVPFIYAKSFIFKEESAQKAVLFLSIIFGTIAGFVLFFIKLGLPNNFIVKIITYGLKIFIPYFTFSFYFVNLINKNIVVAVNGGKDVDLAGEMCLYFGLQMLMYSLIILMFEIFAKFTFGKKNEVVRPISDGENAINSNAKSIEVNSLVKHFSKGICNKTTVKAVNNISFNLDYGDCFALLGVNGAGKTTTFKCLTFEITPDQGDIAIEGLRLSENFDKIRNSIGYCPQFDAFFEFLTVQENLEFFAKVRGIPGGRIPEIIDSLITELKLEAFRGKISQKLSGGNKRKLSVAIALIGNPAIILLDEPSAGMDPEARRFMWTVIHKVTKKRKQSSVILTTHSMEEAETLCRRMGIMVAGEFKVLGTAQEIKNKLGDEFEVNLKIADFPEERIDLINNKGISGFDLDLMVTGENILKVLSDIDKANYSRLICENNIGRDIQNQVK
jgi:ATP-binding cassette subfamily A (ABC1) protein 3